MSLHGVEEAVVKIDPPFVHLSIAVWQNARPCDREAVVSHPERGHDREVGVIKMVVVARRVESVAVVNGTRLLGKAIPYGLAFSIEVPGSFDLRSCGGKAPLEPSGEICRCVYHFSSRLFHFPELKIQASRCGCLRLQAVRLRLQAVRSSRGLQIENRIAGIRSRNFHHSGAAKQHFFCKFG